MTVPEPLIPYSRECVQSQREHWRHNKWLPVFRDHDHLDLYDELVSHDEQANGIARSFIHDRAGRKPIELFLLTMVWGFGMGNNLGPFRTDRILNEKRATEKLGSIVEASRRDGAAAGWHALVRTQKIRYLDISFGTKLLYFAGYKEPHRPRPLILDDRVRWSLYDLARGTVPPPGPYRLNEAHYMQYLEKAEAWAAAPSWSQEPDVVEFGLYELNGVYDVTVCIDPHRQRAGRTTENKRGRLTGPRG